MGAHRADRIPEGGSVLNAEPVNRIRVVRAPDLRRIVQHAGVKSSAPAAAALNEQLRIPGAEPFQEIVQTEDIVIENSACLPAGLRVNLRNRAVVIPLHIVDRAHVDDPADLIIDGIHYFPAREIQHQLVACPHRLSSGNCERPVRMRPEKIAVLIDHLRLKPDAEQKAHVMNLPNQPVEIPDLLFIDKPVSKPAVVRIPLPEPAVIQDKQIQIQSLRLPGQVQNLLRVEGQITALPAVEQHRTHPVPPVSAHHMAADAVVKLP